MKHVITSAILLMIVWACSPEKNQSSKPMEFTLTKTELLNKIKGGWAGQVIGCTFGGPTEFKFKGCMIHDYQPIIWDNTRMLWYYENDPGLYDDIYMDLTFVDVFNRCGLDAPADSHAIHYATAKYKLWHANQAGRYNILNGIMPPQSGHWHNNPHADCIDFQIEADFAGLMSPGMVNVSSSICDKIGHIMNYGDGWYGGVYVAAMYSLAFVSNDIEYIVTEALKAIPSESKFYKVMSDVIASYKQSPDDWKKTWFLVEKNHSEDIGCPNGVFNAFNIDATINSAYVIIGLLYGKGDYGKSLDISTRCGQDSDCNPATVGGILGTMLGYNNIPEYWKQGLKQVENLDFKYTSISLNDVYEMSMNQAVENIQRNGGTITDQQVKIITNPIQPVQLEVNFAGLVPSENKTLNFDSNYTASLNFYGNAIVIPGWFNAYNDTSYKNQIARIEITIDNNREIIELPMNVITRKADVYWNYKLKEENHTFSIRWMNADPKIKMNISSAIIYKGKK